MKQWFACAAAVVVVLGGTSCGPALLGSCTAPAGGAGTPTLCIEYESHPSGAAGLQSVCQQQSGSTWSTAGCSTANRVGRCRVVSTSGGASSVYVNHYYAPLTTEQARTSCQGQAGSDRTATFLE